MNEETKPPYETIDRLLESENIVRYDFKNETKDLVDENHQIIKFLKYKNAKGSDCDSCTLATDLYKKLWGIDIKGNRMVQSDTMNSFWTTYRFALELLIGKLLKQIILDSEEIDDNTNKDLIYKFTILFRTEEVRKEGVLNERLKSYFKSEDEYSKHLSYISKGTKKKPEANLYEFLINNYKKIEELLNESFKDDGCIIRILKNLKEFATLTHTIGNFTLVPKGYNVSRRNSTEDYWDLTLEAQRAFLGNKAFEEMVHRYRLEDYVVKNGTNIQVKPLFSGHSFENILSKEKVDFLFQSKEPTILNDLSESLFKQKCKELDECLVSINKRIKLRGNKLVDILKRKVVAFEIASEDKKAEDSTVFLEIVKMIEKAKKNDKNYDSLKELGKNLAEKNIIENQLIENEEIRSLMKKAIIKVFFEGETKRINSTPLAEFITGLNSCNQRNENDIEKRIAN